MLQASCLLWCLSLLFHLVVWLCILAFCLLTVILLVIDVTCLLEVRWRRHGTRMLVRMGRRDKLRWSGKGDGVGGVGGMGKEELWEKVVEV